MARKTPPHLRRSARPVTRAKPLITVFSEGKNSEPIYLKSFSRNFGTGVVAMEVHPGAGVPSSLVEKAVSAQRVARRANRGNSFAEDDQFWVAFDCDEHPGIAQAMDYALANGIRIAYSNPCFEVWLLLHCDAAIDAPIHRHAAQKLLEQNVQSYSSQSGKTIRFEEIASAYERACERARIMRARRKEEGNPTGNPYTDFDLLTEAIRLGPQK